MPSGSFTARAVVRKSASGSLSADAALVGGFTIDAWILGERWRHHRVRDHFGPESDLYVVLSDDVGPYVEGTPVHWVLADLVQRLTYLEDYARTRSSFSADAVISGNAIIVDAVVWRTMAATITADAVLVRGGSLTADAFVAGAITVDAFIV